MGLSLSGRVPTPLGQQIQGKYTPEGLTPNAQLAAGASAYGSRVGAIASMYGSQVSAYNSRQQCSGMGGLFGAQQPAAPAANG